MFPCTSCGLCCKHISHIKELKEYDLGNGVCKYLNLDTNECLMYDKRPDICKVDEMFNKKYHKCYTKEEFYKLNADACNRLQKLYKIDESYRVYIEKF